MTRSTSRCDDKLLNEWTHKPLTLLQFKIIFIMQVLMTMTMFWLLSTSFNPPGIFFGRRGLTWSETRVRKKYANSLSTFGILIFESKISGQKTGKNYVQKIIKKSCQVAVKITHKSQILFFKEILIKTFSSSPSIYFHQRLWILTNYISSHFDNSLTRLTGSGI